MAKLLHLGEANDIAVNYRESADTANEVVQQVKKKGANAEAVQADVRDSDAVSNMVEDVARMFDGLDAVINNAESSDRILQLTLLMTSGKMWWKQTLVERSTRREQQFRTWPWMVI